MLFFKIVREALTNTYKHAGASQVETLVRYVLGPLDRTVGDDGVEIVGTATNRSDRGSLGLVGIREWAEAFGRTLAISRGAICSTRFAVRLPD
jgi:signal transduction histidine kinase